MATVWGRIGDRGETQLARWRPEEFLELQEVADVLDRRPSFPRACKPPLLRAPGQLTGRVLALFGDVQVKPNQSLPGTQMLENAVGGLMTAALVVCVAAIVFGGGAWAFGERRANLTAAHLGRRLVEGGLLGGVLIGGAVALVNRAFGLGGGF